MNEQMIDGLKKSIRDVPDFPKKGILFKDLTTLLKDRQRFKESIELISSIYQNKKIDKVVGIEARGFIFGAAIAYKLGAGFIPVRKKGKLPAEVAEVSYQLEYGQDTLQMHRDAVTADDKVLIVDDLLATGGTAKAVCDLIKDSGAQILGIEFLVELTALKGIDKLKGYPTHSILKF